MGIAQYNCRETRSSLLCGIVAGEVVHLVKIGRDLIIIAGERGNVWRRWIILRWSEGRRRLLAERKEKTWLNLKEVGQHVGCSLGETNGELMGVFQRSRLTARLEHSLESSNVVPVNCAMNHLLWLDPISLLGNYCIYGHPGLLPAAEAEAGYWVGGAPGTEFQGKWSIKTGEDIANWRNMFQF